MIQYLHHRNINKMEWDNCMTKSPNGHVFGFSWFLDITSPNKWDGIVDMESIDEKIVYVSVMPLEYRRILFLKYLYQSPFILELQVYSIDPHIPDDYFKQFYEKAIKSTFYVAKLQFSPEFNVPTKKRNLTTFILDLNKEYETLHHGYKRGRKSDIKKAKNNGIQINESPDTKPLLSLHKKEILPKFQYKLINQFYETSEAILNECLQNDRVKIINATFQHETIAAAAILLANNKICYYIASSNQVGKKLGAASLIVDYVIKIFHNQNLVLDFMGSDAESIGYFKKSFGSEAKYYQEIHVNNLPFPIKIVQYLRQKLFYPGSENKRYN